MPSPDSERWTHNVADPTKHNPAGLDVPQPPEEMPMYGKTLAAASGGMGVEVAKLAQQQLAPIGYRPTITEQLGMRRAQLLAELANLDAAIAKAKEQEGAMGLLDAISKTDVMNRNY